MILSFTIICLLSYCYLVVCCMYTIHCPLQSGTNISRFVVLVTVASLWHWIWLFAIFYGTCILLLLENLCVRFLCFSSPTPFSGSVVAIAICTSLCSLDATEFVWNVHVKPLCQPRPPQLMSSIASYWYLKHVHSERTQNVFITFTFNWFLIKLLPLHFELQPTLTSCS